MLLSILLISACGSDSKPESEDADVIPETEIIENSLATADFNFSGSFVETQTVTVIPTVIDADGTDNASYQFSWYIDDIAIANNTTNTITLTSAQIGKSIHLAITFSDDRGHTESITSESYTIAMMENTAATADFEIIGAFVEAQTVTVTPTVSDTDGLTNTEYEYIWYLDDVVIEDIITNSITLTTDQIGKALRFDLAFIDDRGNEEVISSESYTVAMMANRVATADFAITGNFIEAQTVIITPMVTDTDGISNVEYGYIWYLDDVVIEDNTTNSITLMTAHIGKKLRFDLVFSDDRGHDEIVSSGSYSVAMMANRVATAVFDFSAAFEEQQTVTVTPTITDADGIAGINYSYQWYKAGVLLNDVTGNEITFTPADNGKAVYFVLTFFDDREHSESITSDTFTIANKTELLAFTADVYDLFIGSSADSGDTWSWREKLDPIKIDEVSDTYKELYYPNAVTDNKGNIVVVMQSEYYEAFGGEYDVVYAYSNDNGATFSNLDLINAHDTADSRYDDSVNIATDSKGQWLAIWTTGEDSPSPELTGLGNDADVVYAVSTDNGVSFSSPKVVGDFAFSDGVNERDRMPDIGMHEDIWTVVWATSRDLTGGSDIDEDIVYSYSEDKGVTWSDPAYINTWASTDSQTDYFPKISMNSSGFAVTIWAGHGSNASLDIYAATSTDFGKTWGEPKLINSYGLTNTSSEHDYPNHIEVTEDNITIISWEGKNTVNGTDNDVYYSFSKDLGKTWSAEATMNPNADSDTESHQALTVTQTPDGKWIAVYNDYTNEKSYLRKSDDLITWSTPVLLKDSVYYSSSLVFH